MDFFFIILILATLSGIILSGCPGGYFRASNTTCLHLAQPKVAKHQYCALKGGTLFGRPVTEDLQEALARAIKKESEAWMPAGTWVGMERSGRDKPGSSETTWKFSSDGDAFNPMEYTLWHKQPEYEKDCGAVGRDTDFKANPSKCSASYALLCEKDGAPCGSSGVSYVNYSGYCLAVVKDIKMYDSAKGACLDGHLPAIRDESFIESIWQAFYNSKFAGGVYVGLDKTDSGTWLYKNGEEEESEVQSADDGDNSNCGFLRLVTNVTLDFYSLQCDEDKMWFLCEKTCFLKG